MKNICLLIFDLRSGGAEHVLSEWSILLSKDFNVYMTIFDHQDQIYYPYGGKLINLNVPSRNGNLLSKIGIVLKRAYRLKTFVRDYKIDMVLSFCNECNLVNTISLHGAVKLCSIRSASDVHSNRFVEYVIRSKGNKLIVQTESLKKSIITEFGSQLSDKLFVIGNPFDTDRIRAMAQEKTTVDLMELLENRKTIVYVASFKQQKNHSGLLRIFEIVAEKIPDVYLLLIGANSTGLQEKVQQMANKSKFSDRILFIGEQNNPFAFDSRCSVFVLPSLAEGIPNALAEAMICSAPVVAADCPTGPAELLCKDSSTKIFNDDGLLYADYGVLVKKFKGYTDYNYGGSNEEFEPFAKAIINILENTSVRNDLVTRSKEGSKRFDLEKYRTQLVCFINNMFD